MSRLFNLRPLRRILPLLAMAAILLLTTSMLFAQTSATVVNGVNMRLGPSENWRIVGGASAGSAISIDGRDEFSTWVLARSSTGVYGWIIANATSLTYQEVQALPIVPRDAAINAAAGAPAVPAASGDAAPRAAVSTSAVRGFSYGGQVQSLDNRSVTAMYQAKMTWVKTQVRWTFGATADSWAGYISNAHNLGFRVLLSVVGTPTAVTQEGFDNAFADYVAGLAGLGADAIEVWNEPNLPHEWATGSINPASYTRLLTASYSRIKASNPNTLVISAAPSPTGFFGGCGATGCDDAPFLRGMVAAGALNSADCVGVHYNEGILSPTRSSGDPRNPFYTRYYSGMVNTYWNIIAGRKPLCITEIGYVSSEGYGPLPPNFAWGASTTVANQAQWLREAVNLAQRSGRVRIMIIWNVDFAGYGVDPQGGYAIIRPDGSCPACVALGGR